jgi:hypothetical protein
LIHCQLVALGQEASLVDPIEINSQNWEGRATISARDATGDYMHNRFRAGEDALHIGAEMPRPMQALQE